MNAPNEATRRQIAAADPLRSTWLGANAGSGKTRVLTDRVARLLLDRVKPQNILCLTFTKAAASEMQNRLFTRLGDWAMMEDAALREMLADLGVSGSLDSARLDDARRLFARAIETPGGLKIQTIHAFCASLLRQFPLEAGVSPQFSELDERSLAVLCDEVLENLSEGPEGSVVDGIAAYLSGDDLAGLTGAILRHRDDFSPPMDLAALLAAHDLPPGFSEEALLAEVFDGDEVDLVATLLPKLDAKGGTDAKAADKLRPLAIGEPSLHTLSVMEDVLLSGAGAKIPFTAKIGGFPTKPTQSLLGPDVTDALNDLMLRVEAARPRRLALLSARKTAALHRFAAHFLPAIAARKAEGGWLDFDDLIFKARDLLTDPKVADWVLFKLDGGIDHILVDEAQDTSPAQWQVVSLLAREFAVGASARETLRTIFVVGDKKQSIYSFQGADPAEFDQLHRLFTERLNASGEGLQEQSLEHSFRSSRAILDVVDATFGGEAAAGIGGTTRHAAFKTGLPGRVDLWPVVEAVLPEDQVKAWFEPVDKISPKHEYAVLADAIAGELARLITSGETIPDGKGGRKPLSEGDVLILVQRRGHLFREILRACKSAGLRIAGADRLVLTRDLAVKDLLALLSVLALREDDLSLATALRSPLFGWSEDAIYRLAEPRHGPLHKALRARTDFPETRAMLEDLEGRADFDRPYDLLERILTRHGGREKLLARLGPDCEEAIDALLGEALIYEQNDVPSLTGFLEWMRGDEVQIKRQADTTGTRLRVMTVHGAKGLEAPLVILPDCAARRASQPGAVLLTEARWAAWPPAAADMPPMIQASKEALQSAQADERLRLLYVAMTRAEVWLWVCAAGDLGKKGDSWHDLVANGMRACKPERVVFPTGEGQRCAFNDWFSGDLSGPLPIRAPADPPPHWVGLHAPPPLPRPQTLSPSQLGGAKALVGDLGQEEETALRRGRVLHLLLEHLPDFPEASWLTLTPDLLAMGEDNVHADEVDALLSEATAVLTNPALAHLFCAEALSEVDITAQLDGLGRRLHGTVDRLIVSENRVLAIDFKTNTTVPMTPESVPEGILRQLGAYCEALSLIYPDRTIDTAVLWTSSAQLMTLPRALTAAALARSELA